VNSALNPFLPSEEAAGTAAAHEETPRNDRQHKEYWIISLFEIQQECSRYIVPKPVREFLELQINKRYFDLKCPNLSCCLLSSYL
jgi:hypothetical protein